MFVLHSDLPEKLTKAMRWNLDRRNMYEKLMKHTENWDDIEIISQIIEDEKKHYVILNELYIDLVGRKPDIPERNKPFTHQNFIEGIEKAIDREVKSCEFYKSICFLNKSPYIRSIFTRMLADEKDHFTKLNHMYIRAKV